jgi:secreted trypsin-like serine protease
MNHGRAATRGELPWHVSVAVRRNRGPAFTAFEGHRGGGTIIGTRWVLTAAHCLAVVSDLLNPDGHLAPTRDVRLSIVNGRDLGVPDREVDVTFARVHPQFNPRSLEYDAALLRLSDDVSGAIELSDDELTPGDCGIVAGWEETRGSVAMTPHLSWARMHVGPDDMCAVQTSGGLIGRSVTMFAAGGHDARCPEFPSASVRKGDSGGGFVVVRGGQPRLCGVASWSASVPYRDERPLVLTRTSAITDWVAHEIAAS